MAQLTVVGADKPQQGQPLSPREEAIRRLKEKGILDPEGKPMPRRQFLIGLALAWATFAAAMGGGLTALFAFMIPRVDFTKIDVFKVGPPANLHHLGRTLELVSQGLDLFRHRGTEQQRLAPLWQRPDNVANGRQEPHVEHPIAFIEHKELQC